MVILDRMLSGMDGVSVLLSARKEGFAAPVLMLTALGELSDRITGLDAGADDYLVKPFETGKRSGALPFCSQAFWEQRFLR